MEEFIKTPNIIEEQDDFIDRFMSQFNSKSTISAYMTAIKDFFGTEDIVATIKCTTFNDIQNYIKKLSEEGKKTNTIKTRIALLRNIFNFVNDEEIVIENRFVDRRIKKALALITVTDEVPRSRALSEEEVSKLLSATGKKYKHKDLITLMLRTGLRREEVVNVHTSDIIYRATEHQNFLKVKRVNSDSIRYIELSEASVNMMQRYSDGYPFNIDLSTINNILKKYSLKAGIGEVTTRDLRITYAKLLVENGCGLNYIQQALGCSMSAAMKYFENQNPLIAPINDNQGKSVNETFNYMPTFDSKNMIDILMPDAIQTPYDSEPLEQEVAVAANGLNDRGFPSKSESNDVMDVNSINDSDYDDPITLLKTIESLD